MFKVNDPLSLKWATSILLVTNHYDLILQYYENNKSIIFI